MSARKSSIFARKSRKDAQDYVAEASSLAKWAVAKTGLAVKQDPYGAVAREVKRLSGVEVPKSQIYALVRKVNSLKSVGAHVYDALKTAYEITRDRQEEAFLNERSIAIEAGHSPALVRAASVVAGVNTQAPSEFNAGAGQ